MILLILSVTSLMLAVLQCGLFIKNLPLFLVNWESPKEESTCANLLETPRVSALIPARDEERGISGSIRSILASEGVDLEIIVLDDHSTDATASIVWQHANEDERVRCLSSAQLPPGWNGKQHACMQLAKAATFDRLVFLDADVRLKPDSLRKMLW